MKIVIEYIPPVTCYIVTQDGVKSWGYVIAVFGEPAGALERWTRNTLIWEVLEGTGQYFLLGMWQHDEFLTSTSLCHPAGIALSTTWRLLGQDISALPGKGYPGNPFTPTGCSAGTMEMYHCFFVYLSLLNNVEWNQFFFLEGSGSQITGKRILVQFVVVYFLKGQETFQHLQMKQEEIKLLSSEAHLDSADHKPDPPQKLCSRCCVFMLNLQRLVPWQGWGLGQGLGKTQLKASGSRWASWSLLSLSRHRVRLSKSPVSVGPDVIV